MVMNPGQGNPPKHNVKINIQDKEAHLNTPSGKMFKNWDRSQSGYEGWNDQNLL